MSSTLDCSNDNMITYEDWIGNESVELLDELPPLEVTDVHITYLNQTSLILNWTESPSDDTKDYTVYQDNRLIAVVPSTPSKLQPIQYKVTGLTPATDYTFTIKARDYSDNEAEGVRVSVRTQGLHALAMNGVSDYIRLPRMTFDTVELTCQLNLLPNKEYVFIDARPGISTAYFGTNANGNIQFGPVWTEVLVNGKVPPNFNDIKNMTAEFTLTISLSVPGTSEITIFSNYRHMFHVPGRIYAINVYHGETLMAAYNLTEPFQGTAITDTSGNNRTATLQGGRWMMD